MRILLSFSGEQYRPGTAPAAQSLWGTSANVLARTLYETLSAIGEVTYIDHDEIDRVRGQSFDLFVGIVKRFAEISTACEADRRIVFTVNMHPATRNDLLLDFLARERLPFGSIGQDDLVGNALEIESALDQATGVLGVGNAVTYASYVENGLAPGKLRLLNYATRPSRTRPVSPRSDGATFLYAAHQLGLRQGFDIVCSSFGALAEVRQDWKLVVLGRPVRPVYQRKLSQLRRRLGERLTQHDWLPPASTRYEDVLASTDFVFYPAIEAGQSGSVLDPLSCGAIPLISDRTGVDFSPLGHCEVTVDPTHNLKLLHEALSLDAAARQDLRVDGLTYYRTHHEGFQRELADAIEVCVGAEQPAGGPKPPGYTNPSPVPTEVGARRGPLGYRLRRRYLFARFMSAGRVRRWGYRLVNTLTRSSR